MVDLHRVHRANDIAERIVLEGIRRLSEDGHEMRVVDPGGILGEGYAGSGELAHGARPDGGYRPEFFETLDEAVAGPR